MTFLKIDDRQNLVIVGHERAVVYDPREKRVVITYPAPYVACDRFALEWKRDAFVIAGWETPLTCHAASTGEERWAAEQVYQSTHLNLHPTEPFVIVSGVSTKPHRGVVLCDLMTGAISIPSTEQRTVSERLVHPAGAVEVDQYDDYLGDAARWSCRRREHQEFGFWGPKSLIGHAFSRDTLLLAGMDLQLTLVDVRAGTSKRDILALTVPRFFGPVCYCRSTEAFRVVVREGDVLESQVLEIQSDGTGVRQLCTIPDDLTGVFLDDGERICHERGEIYSATTGDLLETLDFEALSREGASTRTPTTTEPGLR